MKMYSLIIAIFILTPSVWAAGAYTNTNSPLTEGEITMEQSKDNSKLSNEALITIEGTAAERLWNSLSNSNEMVSKDGQKAQRVGQDYKCKSNTSFLGGISIKCEILIKNLSSGTIR